MLEYRQHVPAGAQDGAPLVVLLHGRGADMNDLMGLQPHLPTNAMLVCPQAPFPAAQWGYGPGWAWYRVFMGPRPRPEPASFEQTQQALGAFLSELSARLPVKPGNLVLGGFSQGGTVSTAYALRNPGKVALVLNFSGFLADHPGVTATPETVRGTRFFWGHGVVDNMMPFSVGQEGREALRAAGADLVTFDFRGGHWIEPEELAAAARLIGELK